MRKRLHVRNQPLSEGAWVYLKNRNPKHKLEQRYEGPFRIVKVDERRMVYTLQDLAGNLHPSDVTIDRLKLSNQQLNETDLESCDVEAIVNHEKADDGTIRYWVKWLGTSDSENTLEPFHAFNDTAIIEEYWKRRGSTLRWSPLLNSILTIYCA
jgi:hypothetical protein